MVKPTSIESALPHTTGLMRCHVCGHEQIDVLRSSVVAGVCPACGSAKYVRDSFVFPADGERWMCSHCDSQLFTIYRNERGVFTMCAGCGDTKLPPWQ